jgi:hypothetical protein
MLNAKYGTVDLLDCIALAIPDLAVKPLGNVNTGYRGAQALIRRHPHTGGSGRTITPELENEERIQKSLIIGHHLTPH